MDLQGKIFDFLGDSITEGVGVNDLNNRYDNLIKSKCNLTATYNYGIGGTRIAYQSKPSGCPCADLYFCGRAYHLNSDADVIVVFGGTNDYGHGDAPFGEMTDKTPDTYCGAVDCLMKTLKDLYPNAQIVFMTPAHREGDMNTNSNGKALQDYVDVIIAKGKEYNIAVLDLQKEFKIDPNNTVDKENYAPDGLHFNDAGHKILADCLIEFLNTL